MHEPFGSLDSVHSNKDEHHAINASVTRPQERRQRRPRKRGRKSACISANATSSTASRYMATVAATVQSTRPQCQAGAAALAAQSTWAEADAAAEQGDKQPRRRDKARDGRAAVTGRKNGGVGCRRRNGQEQQHKETGSDAQSDRIRETACMEVEDGHRGNSDAGITGAREMPVRCRATARNATRAVTTAADQ